MKPGNKTTEFWLTIAGMALLALNGTEYITIPWERLTVYAGSAGAYALSRGIAKHGGE